MDATGENTDPSLESHEGASGGPMKAKFTRTAAFNPVPLV
jgi:hypothetical protein